MSPFEAATIAEFVSSSLDLRGRGAASKLARHLGSSTSLISQFVNGRKLPSIDQIFQISDFFGLSGGGADFLVNLLLAEKCGTQRSSRYFKARCGEYAKASKEIATRFTKPSDASLDPTQRAHFYSSWKMTAIRQAVCLKPPLRKREIAKRLKLDISETEAALDQLCTLGLINEEEGELKLGPISTHVGAHDPLVKIHHANWRTKAVEESFPLKEKNIHFTAPMSITKADYIALSHIIHLLLNEVRSRAQVEEAEMLCCLNIDLFHLITSTD